MLEIFALSKSNITDGSKSFENVPNASLLSSKNNSVMIFRFPLSNAQTIGVLQSRINECKTKSWKGASAMRKLSSRNKNEIFAK